MSSLLGMLHLFQYINNFEWIHDEKDVSSNLRIRKLYKIMKYIFVVHQRTFLNYTVNELELVLVDIHQRTLYNQYTNEYTKTIWNTIKSIRDRRYKKISKIRYSLETQSVQKEHVQWPAYCKGQTQKGKQAMCKIRTM